VPSILEYLAVKRKLSPTEFTRSPWVEGQIREIQPGIYLRLSSSHSYNVSKKPPLIKVCKSNDFYAIKDLLRAEEF
jgi:hypothetical protein